MQNETKSLLLPQLQTIANSHIDAWLCVSPMKLKLSLKDSGFIMLQQIDLCKFQPKQAYALASVTSSMWHSRTKMGKAKKCLQPTRNTYVAKDLHVM